MAEQGWVETRGRQHRGLHGSWTIKKINPESPRKETAVEPAVQADTPQTSKLPIRQRDSSNAGDFNDNNHSSSTLAFESIDPAGARTLDATRSARESSPSNAKDGTNKYPRKNRDNSYISGLPAYVRADVMSKKAEKNNKDISFQRRFEGTLAKHEGKKVPANTSKMDVEKDNYDADRSNSNISDTAAENESFNREPPQEPLGKRRSVWVRHEMKVAKKAAKEPERERFENHRPESNERSYGIQVGPYSNQSHHQQYSDVEMSYGTTMVDERQNNGSKRKRENEDTDMMEAPEYMRPENGRKR